MIYRKSQLLITHLHGGDMEHALDLTPDHTHAGGVPSDAALPPIGGGALRHPGHYPIAFSGKRLTLCQASQALDLTRMQVVYLLTQPYLPLAVRAVALSGILGLTLQVP